MLLLLLLHPCRADQSPLPVAGHVLVEEAGAALLAIVPYGQAAAPLIA